MAFGSWPARPVWLDAAIALVVGVVGQAVIDLAFASAGGALTPVAGLILPGAVGALAALLTRRGAAGIGVWVGVILGSEVAALLAAADRPRDLTSVALASGAAALGFLAIFGVRASSAQPAFQPPSPVDRERVASELTAQLRSIDPQAAGAFERAVTLLRQTNEQLQLYGPFSSWQMGVSDAPAPRAPRDLIQAQAELIEVARLAALASGARRVTITSSQVGVDVQAIFGDPIVGEPVPGPEEGRTGPPFA